MLCIDDCQTLNGNERERDRSDYSYFSDVMMPAGK